MIILVLVAPFIRPANKVGDTPPLPYYLYCLIGIAVMFFGLLYWVVWWLVLPYVFKSRLVPRKEILEDGTVVTVVSRLTWLRMSDTFCRMVGADYNIVFQRKGVVKATRRRRGGVKVTVRTDVTDEDLFLG
jgi:hypothetical protein